MRAHPRASIVTIDGASVPIQTSYTFTGVANAHSLRSSFAPETFTVTSSVVLTADGLPHGTISPSGPRSYVWGATPTYTFALQRGYLVFEVLVDGVRVAPLPRTSYTFAPLTAGHTISVRFAKTGP